MIQPNKVTTARYDLSSIQKNTIYEIIGQLQDKMTREETLFGEQIFGLKLSDLDSSGDYRHIKSQLDNLRYKSVEYVRMADNGKETEVVSSLIAGWDHERGSKIINIIVPSPVIPYLCHIEKGFTQLRKTIAISLKSKFSKRLYEICCKWMSGKNAPKAFKMTISELCGVMKLPKTYLKPSVFKLKVLEVAQKELKSNADVYFEYAVKKQEKGVYMVNFKLFSKDPKHNKNNTKDSDNASEWHIYVYNMLQQYVYGYEDDKALRVCEELENQDNMRVFYRNLQKKEEKRVNGDFKGLPHFKNTIKKALRDDFNIE